MTAATADVEIEYARTLGTVTTGGQVHIAHGRPERQRICCRHGAAAKHTTKTVAALAPESCGPETMQALLSAGVKPNRLCALCFGVRFRLQYHPAYACRLDANRDAPRS